MTCWLEQLDQLNAHLAEVQARPPSPLKNDALEDLAGAYEDLTFAMQIQTAADRGRVLLLNREIMQRRRDR